MCSRQKNINTMDDLDKDVRYYEYIKEISLRVEIAMKVKR